MEEAESGAWYKLTMQQVFNDSVNNFKWARELYQCVSAPYSKNGYRYKLTDIPEFTDLKVEQCWME